MGCARRCVYWLGLSAKNYRSCLRNPTKRPRARSWTYLVMNGSSHNQRRGSGLGSQIPTQAMRRRCPRVARKAGMFLGLGLIGFNPKPQVPAFSAIANPTLPATNDLDEFQTSNVFFCDSTQSRNRSIIRRANGTALAGRNEYVGMSQLRVWPSLEGY